MRRERFGVLLLLLLVVCGCASAAPGPSQPSAPVERYVRARQDAAALREALNALAAGARREAGVPSEATIAQVRALQPRYLALREELFEIAMLNASAVVQRIEPAFARDVVGRACLALMAGTDLIETFHALAAVLGEDAALRATWNAPDPARDVPPGAWDSALETYRTVTYHELFGRALARLDRWADRLSQWRTGGDADLLALFLDGIPVERERAARAHALLAARIGEEDLRADREALARLLDASRRARGEWAALAPVLRRDLEADGGLVRGSVHSRLQQVRGEFLALREGLYGLAFRHLPKVTRDDVAYPQALRLRAAALSLVAAATLYDNGAAIDHTLLALPGVRALFNQGDKVLGIERGFWDHVQREFIRWEYRTLLERSLALIETARAQDVADVADDAIVVWAIRELAGSAAVAEAHRDRTLKAVALAVRPYVRQLNVLEGGVVRMGRVQASRIFGNAIGAFEFRQGKLFGQPSWQAFMRGHLQPGDLLVEKTPFRLTDKFIPGHFGHVALYVGTAPELAALGLDRHPWVARHMAAVKEGRTVVEALRDGTQLNTLERFLNVDDVAILRPKPSHVPAEEVQRAIVLAFSHVGKRYDFDFDNNTWDAIVCSELAFQTYVNVRWRVGRALGSYTIAPDDVAVAAGAGADSPFELVAFVHDGHVVHDLTTGLNGEALYARLLGLRYGSVPSR